TKMKTNKSIWDTLPYTDNNKSKHYENSACFFIKYADNYSLLVSI
ncbi:hypothetical protein HMPREF9074_09424, partial [Capnocytophaga sp. oral taxon 329 str. F0087]